MAFKYVFGPVLSSRLGRSLGLDLLGAKTCTLNCVYCEVGATRNLTLERAAYVQARAILDELSAWKGLDLDRPDHITLGGMGEPTLNSGLAEVVAGARGVLPGPPVAVLTNSTLMTDPAVRRELNLADVVLPSMDTLVESEFKALNRPHPGLDIQDVARGLLLFRQGFSGRLFLEVLLAEGFNDSEQNLALLRDYCRELRPDRVDVVTLSRPGTMAKAKAVGPETLGRWREALAAGQAPAGAAAAPAAHGPSGERLRELISASLARRPQTVLQLAAALGARESLVQLAVDELLRQGEIVSSTDQGRTWYRGPDPG
ncbi:MAG: radical SAM protein [Desulfovibrionaceae bacterium]|nr:radical SAM protein [Desulfovibrionaceae bacterium]